jgi:hypothetical protein
LLLLLLLLRPGEGAGGGARAVAETVQHFITAMDSLKLNLVAVDQVGLSQQQQQQQHLLLQFPVKISFTLYILLYLMS